MKHAPRITILIVLAVASLAAQGPLSAQDTAALSLAEQGPFGVGILSVRFVDEARDGRALDTMLWYPADAGKSSYLVPAYEAAPDTSGAPYPLVIYSHHLGGTATSMLGLGPHLASYGFIVASTNHHDENYNISADEGVFFSHIFTDRPLDVLVMLDQMMVLSGEKLDGIVDPDVVGVAGYSAGSVTALMAGGARHDPAYMSDWCTDQPQHATCRDIASAWDEYLALRGLTDMQGTDDLLPATTDTRIQAIMPMAPCRAVMFGERGLAAVTIPTLLMAMELDSTCVYQEDAVFMLEHIGSESRHLLTFKGALHETAVYEPIPSMTAEIKHFAVAFFGHTLQDRADYADYLTAEFANQFENLAWGAVETD